MSERIKSELLAIKAASPDGLLHPLRAVEWATAHEASALYSALEWDDSVAANEYRVDQVRRLIRLHVVTAEGDPVLVSLTFDRKGNGGYRDIADVVKSRALSDIMLADALADLDRVQAKYERIKELMPVWEAVSAAKRRRRSAEYQVVPAGLERGISR